MLSTIGIHVIYLALIWIGTAYTCKDDLPVKFSWSTVEFKYVNDESRDIELDSGYYDPKNIVILDSDIYDGVTYVTTPSLLPGSPATLSRLSDELDSNGSPLLVPFPNWDWQCRTNCAGLVSAFRIKIDKLGRMWVIDSGRIDAFTDNATTICPPKIVAFDLTRDNAVIANYEFPRSQLAPVSLPLALEVQIMDPSGDDTVVYIADTTGDRMLIYHLDLNQSFMIQHPLFENNPAYVNYTINGAPFSIEDGIFYLTLDYNRDVLFFHSLSSGYQCYVDAQFLRLTRPLTPLELQQFSKFKYQRKVHTSCDVITDDGILLFAKLEENAIYAWDTNNAFYPRYFKRVQQNDETLQFISGMKIIENELLVTSSRLQNPLAYGANEKGTVNFRILKASLDSVLTNECY